MRGTQRIHQQMPISRPMQSSVRGPEGLPLGTPPPQAPPEQDPITAQGPQRPVVMPGQLPRSPMGPAAGLGQPMPGAPPSPPPAPSPGNDHMDYGAQGEMQQKTMGDLSAALMKPSGRKGYGLAGGIGEGLNDAAGSISGALVAKALMGARQKGLDLQADARQSHSNQKAQAREDGSPMATPTGGLGTSWRTTDPLRY